MKKIVGLLLVIALISTASDYDGGGRPGAVLRLGWGVRTLGMGRVGVALVEDAEAVGYNPAGLAFALKIQGLLFHRELSLDRTQSSAGFVYPLPIPDARATAEAAWYYLRVGGFDGRDTGGNRTGEFSYDEHIANFAFGIRPLEWLGVGLTARMMFTSVAGKTAEGGAVDLGFQVRPWEGLAVGLCARDVIGSYKWKTAAATEEALPVEYAAGIGYDLDGWLRIEADFVTTDVTRPEWRLGAEYWPVPTLALRAGYETPNLETGEISAGASIVTGLFEGGEMRVDYAFRTDPLGAGPSHAVALSLMF
ncbi:MAG: hypothetical protein NTW26_08415 [bacterium]|nr:hypothetical protein [bacterium]